MTFRVLVAPQEFKGTLTAGEAAEAISRGIGGVIRDAEFDLAPLADGGPGTVDAFLTARPGVERFSRVTDPLGRPLQARWATLDAGATAVIEMASASGLMLLAPDRLAPLDAHTFGTGELIRAALDFGCTRIIVGAGGSATTDGGCGAAAALGARFLDGNGAPLPLGPRHLSRLARLDLSALDERLASRTLEVLCDVRNPLLGEEGTARVYAEQKGADADTLDQLEALLGRLALVTRTQLGRSVETEVGAGAAGGLAFGLAAFCHGHLRQGFDVISETLGLFARVDDAQCVITGEGRLDAQTAFFKGPYALGRLGRMQRKRVVVFAGQVRCPTSSTREAFDEVVAVGSGELPSHADAARLLEEAARRWAMRLR